MSRLIDNMLAAIARRVLGVTPPAAGKAGKGPGPPGAGDTPGSAEAHFADPTRWHLVNSSWVHSMAYHRPSRTLRVRFLDRAAGGYRITCEYKGWPEAKWLDFLSAPSKGKYVHQSGLYGWSYTIV